MAISAAKRGRAYFSSATCSASSLGQGAAHFLGNQDGAELVGARIARILGSLQLGGLAELRQAQCCGRIVLAVCGEELRLEVAQGIELERRRRGIRQHDFQSLRVGLAGRIKWGRAGGPVVLRHQRRSGVQAQAQFQCRARLRAVFARRPAAGVPASDCVR